MKQWIYLDNAAAAFPKPEAVCRAVDAANRGYAVNAGRGSYALARKADEVILSAKEEIKALAGAGEDAQVVLTPSATVACNQIFGGISWRSCDVVYVSPYEHNAVMRVLFHLGAQHGFVIEELAVDRRTLLPDTEHIAYQFRKKRPAVVAVTHVSNVVGCILPVAEIAALAKDAGALVAVDGAQALGVVPVKLFNMAVDFYIFAGHKTLCGPAGTGGFLNLSGAALRPYLAGGTGSDSLSLWMDMRTPGGFEPGSSNTAGAAGLCAAVREIRQTAAAAGNADVFLQRERALSARLAGGLEEIPGAVVYRAGGPGEQTGIVAFNIRGYTAEETAMILDKDFHIAVRAGYQCAPLIHRYLHSESFAGVVRASVGRYTTEEEVDALVRAAREIAEG